MSEQAEDKPQTMQQLLSTMTPEIHQLLKSAVALGRWENGERLTPEQKEHCLQAVIAYDQMFLNPAQRVAHLERDISTCKSAQQPAKPSAEMSSSKTPVTNKAQKDSAQ